MKHDDLLPTCPKARSILAALDILHKAGIDTNLHFEWNATPPAWVAMEPAKYRAVLMADLLPNEARAILGARQAMSDAGMDIVLQVDQAPFRIGIQPPVFPEAIRIAAKEEIRLAVVAALEYQFAMGAADIAIWQAKGCKPDAPQQGDNHA